MIHHKPRQGGFTRVSIGAVTEVMGQTDRLFQFLIRAQSTRNGPSNLGYFKGVGQSCAVIIAFVIEENLSLVFQASEGSRV